MPFTVALNQGGCWNVHVTPPKKAQHCNLPAAWHSLSIPGAVLLGLGHPPQLFLQVLGHSWHQQPVLPVSPFPAEDTHPTVIRELLSALLLPWTSAHLLFSLPKW